MIKKYYQYYKYIPILQIFKYWKFEIGSIGNSRRRREGFTLLELVLYIGIFSILLMVFVQFFSSILDVGQESAAISSVNQDSQFILDRLSFDIHRAQSITTPGVLGEITNSLQIAIDGINYTYYLGSGNLLLSNDSGINMLNGFDTTVSNVTFRKIGNIGGKDTIVIGFTLTSKVLRKGGAEVKNFQTAIGLR
ncbi:MAG: hypothetical protein A3G66_03675 [Candidatus Levybacteria bacterium RIFCSPLOWO2_12_FULL_39_17]|nr:MAG: hypothetical protein A3G66_03675 [Candidatus Levybacteria bacterium RIFCSPLOWO2_12_FULL_39_17]